MSKIEKIPFLTVNVPKSTFGKIYRKRLVEIDFEPDNTIILRNEFVRIKTDFDNEWYGDFKIVKIICIQNKWRVFLGEQIDFFAEGTREVRWWEKNYIKGEGDE